MADKIRTRFAGQKTDIEKMIGVKHTVVDYAERPSRQRGTETYYHVQALLDGGGLVVYSTGSEKLVNFLKVNRPPVCDLVIAKDWRGYYFDGTIFTDEEEEAMIREKFGL